MKTPISYYGGKQTMLKYILPLIPVHKLYTEAFCGGAAVLFAKHPVRSEIINDLNMDLTTFYWIAKVNYAELKCEIDKTLHSRDMHAHAAHILNYPQFFTQAQCAWAVWALCKMSFASMLDGPFGYDFEGEMPKKLSNAKDEFTEHLCARLENVTIENRDALEVIACYDSSEAFHFVDPPYINSDCGHYEGIFNEQNMVDLLKLLERIKGKFMLTMFPFSMIEEYALRNGWTIHRIERTISASKANRRKQEEWMVCNYDNVHGKQTSLF
ncbi:DNA adenine methylase [uncultured Bacteroides sp.]|uniref:DNA adenine methylase n=1 Tax=uncultured Bacteroides sp. TaxID=162156 RepID=UPI002612F655|nr:DNA adenine methylase [uncultured Bacteroides sp.]